MPIFGTGKNPRCSPLIKGKSASNPPFIRGKSAPNPPFIKRKSAPNHPFIEGKSTPNPPFIKGGDWGGFKFGEAHESYPLRRRADHFLSRPKFCHRPLENASQCLVLSKPVGGGLVKVCSIINTALMFCRLYIKSLLTPPFNKGRKVPQCTINRRAAPSSLKAWTVSSGFI